MVAQGRIVNNCHVQGSPSCSPVYPLCAWPSSNLRPSWRPGTHAPWAKGHVTLFRLFGVYFWAQSGLGMGRISLIFFWNGRVEKAECFQFWDSWTKAYRVEQGRSPQISFLIAAGRSTGYTLSKHQTQTYEVNGWRSAVGLPSWSNQLVRHRDLVGCWGSEGFCWDV